MYPAAMTVVIFQKTLHREFTREKNTYSRKWGLKRGRAFA